MGIVQESWTRLVETGIFNNDIGTGHLLVVLTIICTSFFVRFLWVIIQDFRMFNIRLFLTYLSLTSIAMIFTWPHILTMPGSFAGIVVLIVMFWGAKTWTA